MTQPYHGDKIQVVTAGVSTPAKWRGGRGVVMITAPSGTPALLMTADDGATVPVKDINGTAVAAAATANMWNVDLPACSLSMTGGGAMNAWVVGI